MSSKKRNTKTKQKKRQAKKQRRRERKEDVNKATKEVTNDAPEDTSEETSDSSSEMTFEEHLSELHHRVGVCIFAFLVAFAVMYLKSEPILMYLINMGKKIGYHMIYISPQEILIEELKIASILALVIATPIILYQTMRFIAPAFEKAGLKLFTLSIALVGLFSFGAIFSYKILIPFVYDTLYKIGISTGIDAQITVSNYISLFITFIICLGAVFEMPLVCSGLGMIGILTTEWMKKAIKPMMIVTLIVGALITPPDVISQIVVAIPMMALYMLSIGLVAIIERKRKEAVYEA